MKTKSLLILLILLAAGGSAAAQGFRFDAAITQQATVGGNPNVVTIPSGAIVAFCNFPANAVPCTNKATTYTSQTLVTPCSTSTQIVLTGTSSCVASPDAQENWGVWVPAGIYSYTITIAGVNQGPYTVTLFPPSGNYTLASLTVSGTTTLSGAATIPNENAQFFVDGTKYANCGAAYTAAQAYASGTVVVIPGTGPIVDCPATQTTEKIVLRNYDTTRDWCNGIGGSATPPCNAENYNYDDGNVMAGRRFEFTTSHQNANGVSLGTYWLTYLKNATANGNSGADGLSAECNTAGTLTGAFGNCQAHEANVSIQSNGGSFAAATGIIGAVGTFQSAATCVIATTCTQVTNAYGIYGYGLRDNSTGAHPTNAYGGYFRAQSYGATRNYPMAWEGKALAVYTGAGGFDCEDTSHVTHLCFYVDSTSGLNLQAIAVGATNGNGGITFEKSNGAVNLRLNDANISFSNPIVPNTFGNQDIGTTGLPWGNFFLGTAATNNFKFQPAATAGARTINIPEFLAASATLAYNPPPVAGTTDLGSTALPFGNVWLGTAATNNFKLQPGATAAAVTVTMTDPAVATVALPLLGSARAAGIQTKRTAGCATAASLAAVCTTVVTWTTTFADTNYTVSCVGDLITSGVPLNGGLTAKANGSVTFQTVSGTAAAAQYTTIDCKAQHD